MEPGRVPLRLMIRSGFLLNLIGAVVVATLVWALV